MEDWRKETFEKFNEWLLKNFRNELVKDDLGGVYKSLNTASEKLPDNVDVPTAVSIVTSIFNQAGYDTLKEIPIIWSGMYNRDWLLVDRRNFIKEIDLDNYKYVAYSAFKGFNIDKVFIGNTNILDPNGYQFVLCTIDELHLKEGATTLPCVFSLTDVREVYLPSTLEYIEERVLHNIGTDSKLYINMTKEDFKKKVKCAEPYDYNLLVNKLHFTDGGFMKKDVWDLE